MIQIKPTVNYQYKSDKKLFIKEIPFINHLKTLFI